MTSLEGPVMYVTQGLVLHEFVCMARDSDFLVACITLILFDLWYYTLEDRYPSRMCLDNKMIPHYYYIQIRVALPFLT